MERNRAPVFVLGSPRSGTTLLYHMLLSSGGFAVYRAESDVFNLLVPRFGDLSQLKNRKNLMRAWLRSLLFARSGLEAASIESKILAECRNGGDFLRIVMEEIARIQKVDRWADCTPDHLLYLPEIKRTIPNALVVHIIRDGRDVALSMNKLGWIRPLPWEKDLGLPVAALYWEWIVGRGRAHGQALGSDYFEVHFEDLISQPRHTLAKLGEFIDHDLDYDRIQEVAIGSVSAPNTSFKKGEKDFNPVGRWKQMLTPSEIASIERLIGQGLQEFGYGLATPGDKLGASVTSHLRRAVYARFFDTKLWLKSNTPLGRRTNIDILEIGKPPAKDAGAN